jgi:exo-poly-alpha-galacturonosidase
MKAIQFTGWSCPLRSAAAVSGLFFALSGSACARAVLSGLLVPPRGAGSDAVLLVWDHVPAAADYILYVNDVPRQERARQNYARISPLTAAYNQSFYDYYTPARTGIAMVRTDVTSYCADGLQPDTPYTFKVAAVDGAGRLLCESAPLEVKTAAQMSRILSVTEFGARSGAQESAALNTHAIQDAINACPVNGTVLIPAGVFVTGSLHLKSHMTLRIDGTLRASADAADFDFGFFLYPYYTDERYYGVLNADGAQDISITGTGTVDGNGWKSESVPLYAEDGDAPGGLPHFVHSGTRTVMSDGILAASCVERYLQKKGTDFAHATGDQIKNAYASRSTLVIMRHVSGLLIRGVTFTNPANHTVNILDSTDVSVTGSIEQTYDANNGDGIGIICTKNVWLWNNFIDTGDDSIVFSAGVGKAALESGEQGVDTVRVFGNYIHHGHGGVASGSHTALGIRNIRIEDNVFSHTDMPFRCKSAPINGGDVSAVVFQNNAVAEAVQAFILTTEYNDPGTASPYGAAARPAVFHHITVKNCTVYGVRDNTICIIASKDNPHHDIYFEDVTFAAVGRAGSFQRAGGWESLNGCVHAEFRNVRTVSYDDAATKNGNARSWVNVVNCRQVRFPGSR